MYGYTTKAFNQQVKNNIEKLDEDFMFNAKMKNEDK
ncbi:MAG: ORF6N domain-containing protein [Eubacterium sp.]|nr:ORF6N domain-containing protein [Eubacterium sp.]